ncbi:hypothetical protein F4778DRAFT_62523 [Xylariomycetidae sp. FL2044]|nr:hypothetical protein F4778DRAFT_62523 [Xylariomycetidae sp. FL2044]
MRKVDLLEDEELGVLEDKTENLALHSKRTERAHRKMTKKALKTASRLPGIFRLPYELAFEIIVLLRPSDVFSLQRVNRYHRDFIVAEESRIAKRISDWRYACLAQSFRPPVPLENVEDKIRPLLQVPDRQGLLSIHKTKYQNVPPPDPFEICTCLTCRLRWSGLCLIVDFAHWQDNLDKGEPIPTFLRGQAPEWNESLMATNAAIVRKSLRNPLWHARLLEAHLDSTTRSIRRHAANKGNKRPRFRMSPAEFDSGSDLFLERGGPPSVDFPHHRDLYYLLEAYVPNRGWSRECDRWLYLPAEQHDKDIEYVLLWAKKVKTDGRR